MLPPRCEVCESFRPHLELEGDRRTLTVRFEARPVVLCVGHARIAERAGVRTFDDLREYYGEGRRSFVPRRGLERRGTGRRIGDVRAP
jgi:hypothetical protein